MSPAVLRAAGSIGKETAERGLCGYTEKRGRTDMKGKSRRYAIGILMSLLLLQTACGGDTAKTVAAQPAEHAAPRMVQDVTVELGSTATKNSFVLPGVAVNQVELAPGAEISCEQVGSFEIAFVCEGETQTAILTVQDTTPPELTVQDVTCEGGDTITVEQFVVSCSDLSGVRVDFAEEPDYDAIEPQYVKIFAEDGCGNRTEARALLTIDRFFDEVHLEYGAAMTADLLVPNPERYGDAFPQELLSSIGVSDRTDDGTEILREQGTYTVTLTLNEEGVWELTELTLLPAEGEEGVDLEADETEEAPEETGTDTAEAPVAAAGSKTFTFTLDISDTVGPAAEVHDVTVEQCSKITAEDFVLMDTLSDISGIGEITLDGEYPTDTVGTYPVTVLISDGIGNVTALPTQLIVSPDCTGPVFSGLSTMNVQKNPESKPDFRAGVACVDAISGYCKYSVSDSTVNYSAAGRYYVVYTAVDEAGNETVEYRKINVAHDADDTNALVAKWAAQAGSDPLSIKNYVAKNISYSNDWGDSDPVWFGLFEKRGNCYVHAKILGRLLSYAGYSNQLIWTTDKTHYWNIVCIGGTWYHIDATPGTNQAYGLMNDDTRYGALKGRDWDRESWPACG